MEIKKRRYWFFFRKALQYIGNKFGREAGAAVVAHEFAHARQHAVSGFTTIVIWTSVVDELQADCVAGIYMKQALSIGLSESQVDIVSTFMKNIGNYVVYERDWNGTPAMRSVSFRFGYRAEALDSCMASEKNNWGEMGKKTEVEIKKAPEKIDLLMRWGMDLLK